VAISYLATEHIKEKQQMFDVYRDAVAIVISYAYCKVARENFDYDYANESYQVL